MDWGNLGGILTGVLTVSMIITGGLLGLQRGTMSNLRDRSKDLADIIMDLRGRIGDLEKEIADLKADNADLHTDNATIHGENVLLERLNSQSVNWTAVTDLLDHHHTTAEKHWTDIAASLTSVDRNIRALAEELAKQARRRRSGDYDAGKRSQQP